MARLSAEQKLANKAAQKVRDRAFAQRRRAYTDARTAAEQRCQQSPQGTARIAASTALNSHPVVCEKESAALRSQIAELERQLEALTQLQNLRLDELIRDRDKTWGAFRALLNAEMQKLEREYRDVAGVHSAAAWPVPPGVAAEMQRATAATLASAQRSTTR